MNPQKDKHVIVLNWKDANGKTHQEEFVRVGLYGGGCEGRSWVHEWNRPIDGLIHFTAGLKRGVNPFWSYVIMEEDWAELRSTYIVVPTKKLEEVAL